MEAIFESVQWIDPIHAGEFPDLLLPGLEPKVRKFPPFPLLHALPAQVPSDFLREPPDLDRTT